MDYNGRLEKGQCERGSECVLGRVGGLAELEGLSILADGGRGRYRHGGQQDATSGTELPTQQFPVFYFVKVFY